MEDNAEEELYENEALRNEIKKLKSTNHKLYKYSLQEIVNKNT